MSYVEGVVGIRAGDPSNTENCLVRGELSDKESPRGLPTNGEPWLLYRLPSSKQQVSLLAANSLRWHTCESRRRRPRTNQQHYPPRW